MTAMTAATDCCDMQALKAELGADEGVRYRRYRCPAGKWTIGIGHNLQGKRFRPATWAAIQAEHPHLDNALLDDVTELSPALVDRIFADDIEDAIRDLDMLWPQWRDLSEARKRALINWSFQCGINTMQQFKRFWNAMKAGQYEQASECLRDSLWYRQTQPSRTMRVIRQIRDG